MEDTEKQLLAASEEPSSDDPGLEERMKTYSVSRCEGRGEDRTRRDKTRPECRGKSRQDKTRQDIRVGERQYRTRQEMRVGGRQDKTRHEGRGAYEDAQCK